MKTNSRLSKVNVSLPPLRPFRLHGRAAFTGALAITCCLLMGLSSAMAGSPFGDVHGVTLNALGAPVPGVQVSVHSVEDNIDRHIVSDYHGTFVVENLKPGRYQLRATKGGLASSSVTTVDLAPQQDVRVDMTLVAMNGPKPATNATVNADLHTPAASGNSTSEGPLTDREKLLLDRLEQLEERLAALEAKEASGATAAAAPPQAAAVDSHAKSTVTTVAAAQPAPEVPPSTGTSSTAAPAQPAAVVSQAKTSVTTVATDSARTCNRSQPWGRLDCRTR